MTELKQLSGKELEALVADGGRVLADFFFDNCGPCKMQKLILKELAKTAEQLDIVTVELSQAQEIAQKYEIGTVPYLILFEQGEVKARMMGMQQKAALLEVLQG